MTTIGVIWLLTWGGLVSLGLLWLLYREFDRTHEAHRLRKRVDAIEADLDNWGEAAHDRTTTNPELPTTLVPAPQAAQDAPGGATRYEETPEPHRATQGDPGPMATVHVPLSRYTPPPVPGGEPRALTPAEAAKRKRDELERVRLANSGDQPYARLRASRDAAAAEHFTPEENPETQPAIDRRGAGRWIEDDKGRLTYRKDDTR